jgi:hypothetical protein
MSGKSIFRAMKIPDSPSELNQNFFWGGEWAR